MKRLSNDTLIDADPRMPVSANRARRVSFTCMMIAYRTSDVPRLAMDTALQKLEAVDSVCWKSDAVCLEGTRIWLLRMTIDRAHRFASMLLVWTRSNSTIRAPATSELTPGLREHRTNVRPVIRFEHVSVSPKGQNIFESVRMKAWWYCFSQISLHPIDILVHEVKVSPGALSTVCDSALTYFIGKNTPLTQKSCCHLLAVVPSLDADGEIK